MFDVTLTIGLGPANEPVVFEWVDLTKAQAITDIQRRLIDALSKMNGLSQAILDGRLPPAGPATNAVEMVVEFLITEDGAKWHRTVLEYPGMGDEQQALIVGMLTGELSMLTRDTKGKAKPKKAKGNK